MAKSKSQSNEQSTEGLMNLREAAAYLGITDQRVRTVLREGRVEATKNEKTLTETGERLTRNLATDTGRGPSA